MDDAAVTGAAATIWDAPFETAPTRADIEAAAGRIAGHARRTPLLNAPLMDEEAGRRIWVKPEWSCGNDHLVVSLASVSSTTVKVYLTPIGVAYGVAWIHKRGRRDPELPVPEPEHVLGRSICP